jgi:hypothetical protein
VEVVCDTPPGLVLAEVVREVDFDGLWHKTNTLGLAFRAFQAR